MLYVSDGMAFMIYHVRCSFLQPPWWGSAVQARSGAPVYACFANYAWHGHTSLFIKDNNIRIGTGNE